MKNYLKILKTIGLFVLLVGMTEWVKAVTVGSISLSPANRSITYGSSSSIVTYNITITSAGTGNPITVNLSFSGIPTGSSASLDKTSISVQANSTKTATLTITYNNSVVSENTIRVTESFSNKNATSIYSITNKLLSITGTLTPKNKPYDGNSSAIVTGGGLSGIVGTDVVSLAYNFADKNAGDAKPITCTLTGADAGNYSITPPTGLKANITPIPLSFTGSKTYDKSTTVSYSQLTASGVLSGESITLGGNATLSSANAGTFTSFTTNALTTGNANYSNGGTVSFTVNPKPLNFTGSKTYDKTTAVSASQLTVSGVLSGDAVTLGGNATLSGANAGAYASFASNALTTGNANYSNGGTVSFTVSPLPLNFTGSKVFDGTASILPASLKPENTINGEVVSLGGTATVSGTTVNTYNSFATNAITCSNANYSSIGGTLSFTITAPTAVSWSGTTSTDWGTDGNWTPPYLPDATVDVTIANAHPVIAANTEAACKNLTIESSGGLTINAKGSLTVSGNLDNKAGASGLSLVSEVTSLNAENGTGSLLVQGTTSGSATLTRAMKSGNYHLVTSPLGGQTINDFLTTNATIQTGKDANADYRNMRDYNPTANDWNDFFKVGTSATSGNIIPGKGYSIRIKSTQAHQVVFTGTLPNGDIPVENLTGAKWNCIGNPYTSAITINTALDPNTGFLGTNIDNLNSAFGSIYVWDPSSNALEYTVISNASRPYVLQQGQAFMVCLASDKNAVSFNRAMQTHDVALELKSTDNIWPTIQMVATADSINSSTTIAFHDGMTPGLDVSYDAGLLKAGSPIDIYTRLIDDYGIPFAIQALPSDQYGQLVIPVGVDYPKGGEVTFSAKGVYLPAACRPILEDRLTGIKTDLTDQTYTADLSANTAGVGRFYLHTSWSSTGVDSRENSRQLTAWASGNNEINIKGQINNGAVASLFDLQGRLIATHVMREGVRERFSLPAVKPGIYLLQVRDMQQVQVIKVRFGE